MRPPVDFRAHDLGDGRDERWTRWARAQYDALEGSLDLEKAPAVRRLVDRHLPELVPELERLAAAMDRPHAAELLADAVRPPASLFACTQRAVGGELLRNYDFPPDECSGAVLRSGFLRPVLGMSEVVWGLLDGMNGDGLALSLTFGGRQVLGEGLSILLVQRYLLETCGTVGEALAALRGMPIASAQNITLVDGERAATVFVGPDLDAPVLAEDACAANHQHLPVPPAQEEGTRTGARIAAIRAAKSEPEAVRAALLAPPVHVPLGDWGGTLYAAHYRPAAGGVSYLWPDDPAWEQSLYRFEPGPPP
ncbi:hypothetical protein BIV57_02315 [Mangrovactinospora gilvigrisea]|uniref:Peptidase C45 hydrolase domain-containing protein n=1 Tax=Mangrovactinospora gilvigrisea TaxID=1428644 RepID=A0A1J7BK68_9ACTN|nr:C45 family peptidase [Mangrovactinospora gilvigrisea]OIV39083.1 hypothetical protein BIV57_02315 [Mangrovactinospora gilvigrisea]